jgi:hypothetical protein
VALLPKEFLCTQLHRSIQQPLRRILVQQEFYSAGIIKEKAPERGLGVLKFIFGSKKQEPGK